VARPPEVFVRPLTMAEGQRLQRINRTAKDRVRLRRAMVVLASAQGWPVPDIACLAQVWQRYVREVIHDFNAHGLGALDPKWTPLANAESVTVSGMIDMIMPDTVIGGGQGVVASAFLWRGARRDGSRRWDGVPGWLFGDAGAGRVGADLL
jgi:hypothetical protein